MTSRTNIHFWRTEVTIDLIIVQWATAKMKLL
jgi:hypothetical protein